MHRGSTASVLLFLAAVSAAASSLTCDPECEMGDCVPYLGNLTCSCYGNWSGEDCSTFICDTENKCDNGGTCTPNRNNMSEYLCSCPLPYFGDRCQYTVQGNSCDSDPCKNGATCYNLAAGGFKCHCTERWWGVSCNRSRETDKDPCERNNTCYGHGVCIWNDHPWKRFSHCKCDSGYLPIYRCSIAFGHDYCSELTPCVHGTCENLFEFNNETQHVEIYDYFCSCEGGYRGKNCTEEFDVCRDRCGPGNCTPIYANHYYSCSCPPDRTGYDCENFIDPCANCVTGCPLKPRKQLQQ